MECIFAVLSTILGFPMFLGDVREPRTGKFDVFHLIGSAKVDTRLRITYSAVMLMVVSEKMDYSRDVRSDGFIRCYDCNRYRCAEAYKPTSTEIPEWYLLRKEPNWEELFKIYPPTHLKQLNTTIQELSNAWGISVKTLKKYLDSNRLISNGNEYYLNTYEWEQQSYCAGCRGAIKNVVYENPQDGYLALLAQDNLAVLAWKISVRLEGGSYPRDWENSPNAKNSPTRSAISR